MSSAPGFGPAFRRARGPRPRLRAGIAAIVGAGLLASVTGAYTAYALALPLPAIAPEVQPRAAISTPAAEVALPGYGAAAIGEQDAPGTVLAGNDLDSPRSIASITKVVTALVVLDARPIEGDDRGETITLTAEDEQRVADYRAIVGVVAPAPAGTEITQRSVIELMLVHSANNYADTLAAWAFGSVDAYVEAANAWLAENGLEGITVADATGFATESAGTPRALLDLARLALAHPVTATAAGLPVVEVPGIGRFESRNPVLGQDGITGLKTGTTNAAGSCLLFSADAEEAGETVPLVGVVLGGPTSPIVGGDVRALLASTRDDFRRIDLAADGEVVARYEAPWGGSAELRVAEDSAAVTWGAATSSSLIPAPRLRPGDPPEPQDMLVQLGDEQLRVGLEWSGSIPAPDLSWRLEQPLRLWGVLPAEESLAR
ncbi:D-alanyl-D-alanine carboxypeptidase family protein [Microcella flavibacter]|uniref:D-alanyl-D-alanine carboxypeptidase family protein n=1 Tax=Microcella flavibacter TaxID=1804990 RepID=UPI0014577C1C|nr:serine hydrolase [Microcella flavibacter]